MTHFGISPRYLRELRKDNIRPREIAYLENLSNVTSTGMVPSEYLFEWFYDDGFPSHTHLANIAVCFCLESPLSLLYTGGSQGPSLGILVAALNQSDVGVPGIKGTEVPASTADELVAPAAFPTMPVKFMGDDGPQKY